MKPLRIFALFLSLQAGSAWAQGPVTFPLLDQSAQLQADLYGVGPRAVLLAHGGRFDKESWKKQAQILANSGFLVLALRFRGDRINSDGSPSAEGSTADNTADVLAAVSYLHHNGATAVFAVGGSLGGDAVGEADAQSAPGNLDRVVFLGSSGGDHPMKLNGRKLFILARDDRSGYGLRLPGISRCYEQAAQPKKLVILSGSAHAQYLFATDQGPRVMREILQFLSAP